MTQADRDRLVALKKVKKGLISQREAAEELGVSVRQVQRLLVALKKRGDKAVVHGLRGQSSNHKIEEKVRRKVLRILSGEEYRGFGPTLASEYLAQFHEIEASRETVRKWMKEDGLWKADQQGVKQIHQWRPRRSRLGELVQWDTSEHDWLEGRGEGKLYLIAMVDDATSQALAWFAASDSTEENMRMLEKWLLRHGRPQSFYTDKAGLFQTAPKTKRDEQRSEKDQEPLPPTQIGRALRELTIVWIGAHSPQAKGRIERFFQTAQDRMIKGMRLAGVKTREQANGYLEEEYLPWWNSTCTVEARNSDDAHRNLEREHQLEAILSHVETRKVYDNYTIQMDWKIYAIEKADICAGLRGAVVRVEKRRDGTIAIRFRDKYLRYRICEEPEKVKPTRGKKAGRSRRGPNAGGKSKWMEGFHATDGPPIGKAIAIANATS